MIELSTSVSRDMNTISLNKDNIPLSELIEQKTGRYNVVTCGMRGMDRSRITSAFLDKPSCDKTYSLQRIRLDGSEVELLVWDVPLTSRFRQLTWLNLRKAAGVVLCYDVTLYHTFQCIREEWSNHYNGMKPQLQAKKMLVGLQYGTDSKRGVLKSEVESFATNNDMLHLEISLGEKCMVEFLLTGLLAEIKQSEARNEQKDMSISTHTNYSFEKKCLLM